MKTKMTDQVDEEDGQGHMHLLGATEGMCCDADVPACAPRSSQRRFTVALEKCTSKMPCPNSTPLFLYYSLSPFGQLLT